MSNKFSWKNLKKDKEVKNQSKAYNYSKRQEREVNKRFSAWATAGSGNKTTKGDGRVKGKLRIECKATSKKSYSLKKDDWLRIRENAQGLNESVMYVVDFLDEDGEPELELITVDVREFGPLLEAYARGEIDV